MDLNMIIVCGTVVTSGIGGADGELFTVDADGVEVNVYTPGRTGIAKGDRVWLMAKFPITDGVVVAEHIDVSDPDYPVDVDEDWEE